MTAAAANAKERCVPTEFMSQHALCVVNGACTALIGWKSARRIPRRGLPSFSACGPQLPDGSQTPAM